jgi:hypothetical protein
VIDLAEQFLPPLTYCEQAIVAPNVLADGSKKTKIENIIVNNLLINMRIEKT